MNQTLNINRHPNGSIDLDFYRARAVALRGQAMQDAKALRWGIGPLAALAIVGLLASVPKPAVQVAAVATPIMACGAAAPQCQPPTR